MFTWTRSKCISKADANAQHQAYLATQMFIQVVSKLHEKHLLLLQGGSLLQCSNGCATTESKSK